MLHMTALFLLEILMLILVLVKLLLIHETISYTAKSEESFTGLTRGVNFKYDQRVILDTGQNTPEWYINI